MLRVCENVNKALSMTEDPTSWIQPNSVFVFVSHSVFLMLNVFVGITNQTKSQRHIYF